MDYELKQLIQNATSKIEIANLLGYNYYNERISKIINKIQVENNIEFKNLGTRPSTRKRNIIIKICPVCNGEFETYDSGKNEKHTCSRKCSNIFFSKKRSKSLNQKIKRNCSNCSNEIHVKKNAGKNRILYCDVCRLEIRNKRILLSKKYTNTCQYCNTDFKTSKKEQRFCSKSCGSKNTVYNSIKNGTHNGWKTRYKLSASYPERYFIEVLNNSNIEYERERKCGKYFIDFAIDSKKIALEIDGKQHNESDRKNSDLKKDKYLKSKGYTVIRIKWYNPINDTNKELLYNQIEKFKNLFY